MIAAVRVAGDSSPVERVASSRNRRSTSGEALECGARAPPCFGKTKLGWAHPEATVVLRKHGGAFAPPKAFGAPHSNVDTLATRTQCPPRFS
jgi:hypothetical protein